MECKLHEYQRNDVEFIKAHKESALFLDCGLGKTLIILTAISEMFQDLDTTGVLIVAPLRVVHLTWPVEVEKWSHTNWLTTTVLHGKNRLKTLDGQYHIYLVNYEGLADLAKWLHTHTPSSWPFDTVVWDELTCMKSHTSKRFKLWKNLVPKFRRRIGATGTPTPNGLLDLYAQMLMVDGGAALGTRYIAYRDKYFTATDYWGYNFEPREGALNEIMKAIEGVVVQRSAEDFLDLNSARFREVTLQLPKSNRQAYDELEKQMFLQLDSGDVEALSAAALSTKTTQYANGAMYHSTDEFVTIKTWEEVHDVKINALKLIRKEHPDEPLLVAYNFRHDFERLKKAFPEARSLKSGMAKGMEKQLLDDWSKGKVSMMLCHPKSTAHGLNLQYGGRIGVWFGLNWSPELNIQFNKRIDRQGQKKQPLIYRLVMSDTTDEAILASVSSKGESQMKAKGILKRYREKRNK